MNLKYTILVALSNLASSKLRTILAMLGILVGTASVVAMVSTGQLATAQTLKQFKSLGTDLLSLSMYSARGGGQKVPFSLRSALAIFNLDDDILLVAPYTSLYADLYFNGIKLQGGIVGTVAELRNVLKIQMAQGRFISFLDANYFQCVIGQGLYQSMKDHLIGNPIGQQLRIGNVYYTIVGVAAEWPENSFFDQNVNDVVFVHIKNSKLISQSAEINNIIMTLAPNADIDKIENEIQKYIKNIEPDKKTFFRSAKQLIQSMENQRHILTLFLGLIGSISLLVGGIGVMNIMLVSVVERRREIGIRRAIGAKRRDIQKMFLIEAVILALLGGGLGVLIGVSISFIIAFTAHWEFTLYLLPPAIGFTVSVLVGIFFGFYPALQASRLDPIQTLRAE